MKAAVVSFFVFLFSISSHASIEMLGSGWGNGSSFEGTIDSVNLKALKESGGSDQVTMDILSPDKKMVFTIIFIREQAAQGLAYLSVVGKKVTITISKGAVGINVSQ